MKFNTLTPTAKMLGKLKNYSTGQPVTSGDVPLIAVISASTSGCTKKLVENVVHGAKLNEASVFVHNIESFGYTNKINPMTAKYAESFRLLTASSTEAIIRTNMADAAVLITDCEITAAGFLLGCLKSNTPALVLPLGTADQEDVLKTAGKVAQGKLTGTDSEKILQAATLPKDNLSFFRCLENLGFCIENSSTNKCCSGQQYALAIETGKHIVQLAKDLVAPKKILKKESYKTAIEFALSNNIRLSSFEQIKKLFASNDIKVAHESVYDIASKASPRPKVVLAKGSACDKGGYIQYTDNTPSSISGKAWVYNNLEDADRALLSGNIPDNSIIVLHNCVGINITALALAIEGMERTKSIAIATDGLCDETNTLVITSCTPNSLDNEEFANIQTGDALEIDITRGRFNTSILSKDLKTRIKRNTVKKQTTYFA